MADKEYIRFLIKKIAEKEDTKAFEKLFQLYYERLTNFAIYFLSSKEAAEEVVSDIFVKIWSKRKEIAKINNLDTYLYISVKNQSLNSLDKNKINFQTITDADLDNLVNFYNPEKELEVHELIHDIDAAVENLPAQCRLVFKLLKEDGFKYKDVAEILDISPKTVETQLVRGLRKIARAIEPHIENVKRNPKISRFFLF